jgi:hypothetical protein
VSRNEQERQYAASVAALTAATLFAFGIGFMNNDSRESVLIPSLVCLGVFGLLAQWSLVGDGFAQVMLFVGMIALPYAHLEIKNVGLKIGFLSCGVSLALLAGVAYVNKTPTKIAAVYILVFLFFVSAALLLATWWVILIVAASLLFAWRKADQEKACDREEQ